MNHCLPTYARNTWRWRWFAVKILLEIIKSKPEPLYTREEGNLIIIECKYICVCVGKYSSEN